MTTMRFRTPLAPALAVFLACTLSPAPMLATVTAGGVATFTGQVLHTDGETPQPGVTVILVSANGADDVRQQDEFKSAPTGENGSFRIEGAPAGTYVLVIETPEGAFLASESVVLVPGVNPRQVLTLRPGAPGAEAGAGGIGDVTWGQWLIAGAILVAAAVVADEVTKDVKETIISPF